MRVKTASLITFIFASHVAASAHTPTDQSLLRYSNPSFDRVIHALKKASIIPEVVDEFKPKCFVAPFYGRKKTSVALGNDIKPKKTKDKPKVKVYCPNLKETEGMTIVLTDPDAPTRGAAKWGQFCHWIAAVESLSSDDGKDVIDYKPPSPPEKTGPHRYVFLLLEGDNTNLTAPGDRKRWGAPVEKAGYGVREWAEEEGLKVVGANFFYARNKEQ